ncbi:MAG: hypothetical protein WCA98_08815 [Candidatus Acidiferrales bacterium]
MDYALSLFGLRPWRCRECDTRFFAWSVIPASFVACAHCPRCGRMDLEKIAGRLVVDGTLRRLKRILGFAAYRCDPCRERFFSLRRYNPIRAHAAPAGHKPAEAVAADAPRD